MRSGEGYSVYITLVSDHATYSVKYSEDFELLIIPYSDFDDNIKSMKLCKLYSVMMCLNIFVLLHITGTINSDMCLIYKYSYIFSGNLFFGIVINC